MLFLVAPSASRPYNRAERETMDHMHINPSDARDVLDVLGYHNHHGDGECGDFKRNLITAIICAGPEDRARLALGFPSLVAAIKSQTSNPASIEYLEGIARSYERPTGQADARTPSRSRGAPAQDVRPQRHVVSEGSPA